MKKRFFFSFVGLLLFSFTVLGQNGAFYQRVSCWVDSCKTQIFKVGDVWLVQVRVLEKRRKVEIYLNGSASYFPFRTETVNLLYHQADSVVALFYPRYKAVIFADKKELSYLIPNYFRKPGSMDRSRIPLIRKKSVPLVSNLSKSYAVTKGLQNRNIALWGSHGRYYNQLQDRWIWQRSRLFATVEDKLTRDYVLPYLLPMLENAGATVLLPHDRDTQPHEVIVDADFSSGNSFYSEASSAGWKQGGSSGFGWKVDSLLVDKNPFVSGTYRMIRTSRKATDKAVWTPEIPETGEYSVSVAYQTKSNGISDARYTVFHAGGSTSFSVNQQMGGGTWIYLGTFLFEKGVNPEVGRVELSNESQFSDRILIADAVRFGGGYGTVARKPANDSLVDGYNSNNKQKIDYSPFSSKTDYTSSAMPRYLEGARYWLQWAGFPSDVYSRTQGVSDYLDDVWSRGLWVNYLNKGSEFTPDSIGLGIPIDLALGFHTDAGIKQNDSIVGSLGIFMTKEGDERFLNGQSRYISRDLAHLVLSEISETIKRGYHTEWSVRGLWNRSYVEARIPQVPTMLLELLSHQNLTDVRYALDPNFQFSVCRSIYKALLRYFSVQNSFDYVVQPLPVNSLSVGFEKEGVRLSWSETPDTFDTSQAKAQGFVVYTRKEEGGFDNGFFVLDTTVLLPISYNQIHSFKVTAVNEGGESFPSEILSVCKLEKSKGTVLVVNGFDRIAAPDFFDRGSMAGIDDENDCGVPYRKSLFYTGSQYEFKKEAPWIDNDAPGFGASDGNRDSESVAGNSFDYPFLHGQAIRNAGYSFVSCSRKAVERDLIDLKTFRLVDLILGKQRQTLIGKDSLHIRYKTFSSDLQCALIDFCHHGGSLFVSGSYVASDLSEPNDVFFLDYLLKSKLHSAHVSKEGRVEKVFSSVALFTDSLQLAVTPSEKQYNVVSVDGILPTDEQAFSVLRYSENRLDAAIAYKGNYKTFLMGFPFENIVNLQQRNQLMFDVLNFLSSK